MAKKTKHLTESEMKNLIENCVSNVLNEIGYRAASVIDKENYNAQQDLSQNQNPDAMSKMNVSKQLRLQGLGLAVHDTFPNLSLSFVMIDSAQIGEIIEFKFRDFQMIDDSRFVMIGNILDSSNKEHKGSIEYRFKTQEFYIVNYYGSGAIRRVNPLKINPIFSQNVNNFLAFVTNYLYSKDEFISDVNNNGPTKSKHHTKYYKRVDEK